METKDELMYRKYEVEIKFVRGIAGGKPAQAGLIQRHAALFSEGVSNYLKLSKSVEGEVSEEAIAEYLASCTSVFPVDDDGIFIQDFQVCAMLKDACQRMHATLRKKGLGNTIRDGGVVVPPKLYLGVNPMFQETPGNPDNGRSIVARFQVAYPESLVIPLAVIENGDYPDNVFRQSWIVAQTIGLGANRHLGYGRFELVRLDDQGHWNSPTEVWKKGLPKKGVNPVAV